MNFNVSAVSLWACIIDYVKTGELKTMPVPEMGCPSVGDVICLESIEEDDCFTEHPYAYVQVDGVYDYYSPSRCEFQPGMRLLVFHEIKTLSDVVVG